MCATDVRGARRNERGSATVAALILAIVVASLCALMVTSARVSHQKARTRLETDKAFYVAEGGLDFALSQIKEDRAWAVDSTSRFPTLEDDGTFESGWIPMGDGAGEFRMEVAYQVRNPLPADWDEPGLPDGYEPYSNVAIADRADGMPLHDALQIRVVGRYGEVQRTVRANVQFESRIFSAAIVSDSPPLSDDIGTGKGAAKNNGHVSFDSGNQYVYGGVRSNAKITLDEATSEGDISEASLTAHFDGYDGDFFADLYETPEEIPDFTDPGSTEQLFDFGRFKAAALAGAGAYYGSLDDFRDACDTANDAGVPLEGIIYVLVDADVEGGSPKLEMDGGINVLGTLVFDFTNPPDEFYKMFIVCPLNINAATLPADFDPADPTTFTTGYPPVIDPDKDPRGFAIGSADYDDFPATADMPALMFTTGTVDIHDAANICGAVYGPSFIEIENKSTNLQYFNGCILGGGGVYLQGKDSDGAAQVFTFDPSSVNSLPTFGETGTSPTINGYFIGD